MSSLSTQSYKGVRDYYPEDMRLQNYIFKTWRQVVEGFGYDEYGTPLLEPIEIYTAKSGEELATEQTYVFEDRGGRTVAIRPEMTPSLSRMVAGRRQEIPMPARLYSIANFMRYERPQRGRSREFWQLNADLFGVDGELADAEIIEMAHASVMAFGATQAMFKVKVNDRRLVNRLMKDFLGLDVVGSEMMIRLLDRKDKMSSSEFRDKAMDIFGNDAPHGLARLSQLISMKSINELSGILVDDEYSSSLSNLMNVLRRKGIKNAEIDITLMRGLDYYTGTVFEFFDTDPENTRALFGGGRYDGLVSLFGVESLPTVGLALGAESMENFLVTHKLLPEFMSKTDVYIVAIGDESMEGADKLARDLRKEGVRAELDITGKKLDKQIKTAIKKQIPFVAFVGEEELSSGIYTLKNLKTSSEDKVDAVRMVSVVSDYRYNGAEDSVFET